MRWHLFLLVGVLCAGCDQIDTDKANKKVDDANKALKEGGELFDEANDHLKATDKGDAAAEGKKCLKKAEEAGEKFEEAGKLAKDASEMKISKVFSEYLELKSKSFSARGELASTMKKLCKKVGEKSTEVDVVVKLQKDMKTAQEEFTELDEKAAKIQKDNPKDFK